MDGSTDSVIAREQREKVIECRSVWKIFGDNSQAAVQAAQNGTADKEEILKKYGCVVAVMDASFEVFSGETFCIIGLSGSGKSTLIRHFNRLIKPSAGEVLVHGKDICTMNDRALRELRAHQVGMVFQNVALLPYHTVLENVALPLEIQNTPKIDRYAICKAVLKTVGLESWMDKYPAELSGGMQQRLGLARALAINPDILLMDEPFSALDPLIRKRLQIEFRQLSLKLGKTSIFITHDLEEAIRIGDRIAIMKEGKIVQIGTPEQVVLDPADDYVAEFVEGISRLRLVKAHSFMQCRDEAIALAANAPQAGTEDDLQTLIDLSLKHKAEHIAIAEEGRVIGAVSHADLLRAVRG